MSKISETGYLFIDSGILDDEQVEASLNAVIEFLVQDYGEDFSHCITHVNVVKNREGVKFGHTYAWVSDPRVYHAILGKNFDESDRVEFYDDPDWKPPEKSYEDVLEDPDDWSAGIERPMDRCPRLKRELDPIVSLPAVKYNEDQVKEVQGESEYGFLEVFPVKLTKKPDRGNSLFSNDVPVWLNEEILKGYFEKFEPDKTEHFDKKSKKKFRYPTVEFKKKRDGKRSCIVTFSNSNRNTAMFLINLVKRVEFEHEGVEGILFFSQTRLRPG
jgi:hypothetical protein